MMVFFQLEDQIASHVIIQNVLSVLISTMNVKNVLMVGVLITKNRVLFAKMDVKIVQKICMIVCNVHKDMENKWLLLV